MLLVPVEDRTGWRRPPVLVVLLVLVNLFVHVGTERDVRSESTELTSRLDEATAALLVEKEWPLFLAFIESRDTRLWLEIHDAPAEERLPLLENLAWWRGHFSDFVHRHWQDHPPSDAWRSAREKIASWRSELPFIRWGLIPDQVDPPSLLSHMFMHGGWGHFFGNMLFLLLFGVPMERHWGAGRLLPLYLLSGLGAAAFYIATHPDSDTPLVGASGAIAGLMGIYCASYGLRRIEFFYTLGFYFGSFRAPAFAVFPLWVGWELIQKLALDTNVAYMAHVGGLLSGVTATLLMKRFLPARAESGDAEAPAGREDGGREGIPVQIERLARELDFEGALALSLRRLDEKPDWPALWAFALENAPGADPGAADRVLQLAVRKHHHDQIDDRLLAELWQQAGGDTTGKRLPPAALLLVAEALQRRGHADQSRRLVERIGTMDFNHPRLERLRRMLISSRS